MRIADSETSFLAALAARGLALETAPVESVLETMLDWYRVARVTDAGAVEEDGDMLLLQWGTDPQDGTFEYGLTRQLIAASDPEDEGVYQLSVTFRFPADANTEGLDSGSSWCATPGGVQRFYEDLASRPATAHAKMSAATEVRMLFEVAG